MKSTAVLLSLLPLLAAASPVDKRQSDTDTAAAATTIYIYIPYPYQATYDRDTLEAIVTTEPLPESPTPECPAALPNLDPLSEQSGDVAEPPVADIYWPEAKNTTKPEQVEFKTTEIGQFYVGSGYAVEFGGEGRSGPCVEIPQETKGPILCTKGETAMVQNPFVKCTVSVEQ